jgi:predicted DNA-binding transcriptional regulator YafY
MPVNRNALIRYKTIDLCLQNRYRKWTLEDLIKACSDALYEYEGIDKGVSRRTVQMDIQLMRSDKLGYNAPIIVSEKKYYSYEDRDYSIMNIPLSEGDLDKLTETVDFLKQFKGFSHFRELESMVQKLEDHVFSQKVNRKPVIDFEKNEDLKGIEFLGTLYESIIRKNLLEITYKSFTARQPNTFKFYPFLLKEFRNRWFLIGSKNNAYPLYNLALDRILEIRNTNQIFSDETGFEAESYYKNVIGVTVNHGAKAEKIILFVVHKHAPYVLTKPFHPSQELIEENDYGITITLDVQHNFELEKEILGLGDGIVVLSPDRLRANIFERLNNALDQYNTSVTEKGIISLGRKYVQNGFCTVNQLYSRRSINQLSLALSKATIISNKTDEPHNIDIETDKAVSSILFIPSVERIIRQLIGEFIANSVTYYEKILEDFYDFIQPGKSNLELIILLSQPKAKDLSLRIIPGSHKKIHTDHEMNTIVENCNPVTCTLNPGGAIMASSNVIKSFSRSGKKESVRFLVIEIKKTSQ